MVTNNMKDMTNITINKCPRCGSKNVQLKTTNNKLPASPKKGICYDCDLEIECTDANFIAWLFNRSKEDIVAHCLRDLEWAPYTAYIHQSVIDIWDGEKPLKHYFSREKGWKIDIKPATTVGKGFIIDRIR